MLSVALPTHSTIKLSQDILVYPEQSKTHLIDCLHWMYHLLGWVIINTYTVYLHLSREGFQTNRTLVSDAYAGLKINYIIYNFKIMATV